MKRQIRRGVFETNSSSTHSLTICSAEEFEAWKDGELLFDDWGEEFVPAFSLDDSHKKMAKEEYENNKDEFSKDWKDLTENAKNKYYKKYVATHNLIKNYAKTYNDYMHDYDLETFVSSHTTKSGDKIVVFGKYGYDG